MYVQLTFKVNHLPKCLMENKTKPKQTLKSQYLCWMCFPVRLTLKRKQSSQQNLYAFYFLVIFCPFLPFLGLFSCAKQDSLHLCSAPSGMERGYSICQGKQLNWIYSVTKRGFSYRWQAFARLLLKKFIPLNCSLPLSQIFPLSLMEENKKACPIK